MVKNDALNNKGYMLIEMILASVIAFTIAYFAIDMTIKIKDKNDDLLVETLVATDQAILMNSFMSLYTNTYTVEMSFNVLSFPSHRECYNSNQFDKEKLLNLIQNKYVDVQYTPETDCLADNTKIVNNVHLIVKQLPEKNFDFILKYRIPSAAY